VQVARKEMHSMCSVDPRMNGLIAGVGGPVMPIVRYFRIMCVYVYIS
jgi:hypothetical protein